ncbi:MAG TPA: glycosyltransferase family 39 protein [Gemmatimonadaceae bacterium]
MLHDRRIVLALVWVVCVAYAGLRLRRGWVPHDEGALAQSAARVLAGELPHRDFAEIYTGGLSYLNAAVFHLLGARLVVLRLPLYLLFACTVPAMFALAARFLSPWGAALVTVLAVTWSFPNYSAAMPSWYNLFFAMLGTAALARHVERPRAGWLIAAGVCGGVSILAKITGLYYVAGVLLFLVYRAQCMARERAGGEPARGTGSAADAGARERGLAHSVVVSAALLAFVAALVLLVRPLPTSREVVHVVVPGTALALFLLVREWRANGSSTERAAALASLVAPFLAGVLLPVALFLVPYARAGALDALWRGVFVLPARRFTFAAVQPPAVPTALLAIPVGWLLLATPGSRGRGWAERALIGAMLAGVVALAGPVPPIYALIWLSIRTLVPLVVVGGILVLALGRAERSADAGRRQLLVLLLAVTALCSLVQFPFASSIYFCYVAPLLILTLAALLATLRPPGRRFMPALVATFFLAFAVVWVNRGFIYQMGTHFVADSQHARLALPRGGIDVSPHDSMEFAWAAKLLREHAHGDWAYAAPDAPELPFLAGLRNPTRELFDFFGDSAGREQRVLAALDAHDVRVIAINRDPLFSGPLPPHLEAALVARYPDSALAGRFVVRWRP